MNGPEDTNTSRPSHTHRWSAVGRKSRAIVWEKVHRTLRLMTVVPAIMLATAGCREPAANSGFRKDAKAEPTDLARPEHAASENGVFQDEWEVFFVQEAKVGHARTRYRNIQRDGQKLVEITAESRQVMARFGQTVEQKLSLVSIETPEGQLVSFESRLEAGATPMVVRGERRGDVLQLTDTTKGRSETTTVPWKDSTGGLFAQEQSLAASPMQPGEDRSIRCLFPLRNEPVEIVLHADRLESTPLLDGTRKLLKIRSTVRFDARSAIETVVWTDVSGRTLKTYLPQLRQFGYRTDKATALAESTGAPFDLGEHSIVRLKRPIDRAHRTRRAVYRVRLADADPADEFIHDEAQQVRPIDAHTAEIVVRSIRPDGSAGPAGQQNDPPGDGDRLPNNLIQSDDARVVAMASAVAGDASDPGEIATALERYVRESVKSQQFSPAFATAAEVAETLQGDCTEHAVLLAALCRARGIPARCAVGLVYFPAEQAFAYHLWTEAWLDGRWIALDATLGQGGIGAAHLKLVQTNFKGAGALGALLPVFQVLGQLEVEVMRVEY